MRRAARWLAAPRARPALGGRVLWRCSAARPVLVQRDRRGSPARQTLYFAEGDALVPHCPGLQPLRAALRAPRQFLWQAVVVHLLPRGYPDSVAGPYLNYTRWVALATTAGCMSGVLAMQALLGAVGVGGGAAVPLAATLNWVLKDGLGQVGGVLYAAVMRNFDARPKTTNFHGVCLLQVATLLEFSTALCPALFLPIAGLANVAKNVACISLSATKAAIHQSFARQDNLADVTAKAASQAIVAAMGGTALGCLVLTTARAQLLSLVLVFAVLGSVQLYATYRALAHVSFRVFNAPRLQRVLDTLWGPEGRHMGPEEVGRRERFVRLGPPLHFINPPLHTLALDVPRLRRAGAAQPFLLLPHRAPGRMALLVRCGASEQDVMYGFVALHRTRFELARRPPSGAPEADFEAARTAALLYCARELPDLRARWRQLGWEVDRTYLEQDKCRLELLDPPS